MKGFFEKSGSMGYRLLWYTMAVGIIAVFMMLCGCGIEKTNGRKVQDLSYEIVEEENIPEELFTRIEEKKTADFKLTCENGEYLYVVRGYGEQETGGYSIQVLEFYLTKNALVFDTDLKGPAKDEVKNAVPSYPYIVIRTAKSDKNVIFQ